MAALGFASTTDDVLDGVDLTGVTVLVTGTSAGLGVETDRALAARGNRKVEWKSVPQGAATSVWAGFVAAGDEVGGRYCEDCAVSPVIDDPDQSPRVMRYALDPDTAAAPWARSEAMVGESFAP